MHATQLGSSTRQLCSSTMQQAVAPAALACPAPGPALSAASFHPLLRPPAGRRVRHKTAQQKLAEWQAEAKERELEKVAMKHLKEAARKQRQEEREQVRWVLALGLQRVFTSSGKRSASRCGRLLRWACGAGGK